MTTYLAPAKLNLFLHITSRRPDGYHNLQTIFQLLDYGDVLQIEVRDDGQLFCQSTAKNLPPEQDLVLRAAQLLKHYSHTSLGANLSVLKKIPIGGGLGGGSSDAATTLLALNHLWQLQLPLQTLAKLGLQLGADVPIFVYGHTAWAEGVGELLTPIILEEPWYLIIYPHCHVSTKDIFSAPDLTRNCEPVTIKEYRAGLTTNVCEPVVCRRYPQVAQALDWLNQYRPARMTGTGASVFARFDNQAQAEAVLLQIKNSYQWQAFVTQGKNIFPVLQDLRN
jgi:4-diphosphocytidyl-2-C-methyl-D-erythritol kinase